MRKKATDNSSAVSLFPFIAVLLCTMGALLVVLVAVTQIARDKAKQRAESRQIAAEAKPDDSAERNELARVQQHMARLQKIRSDAERQLAEDKLRLSHLEEQMRQLLDQVGGLKAAAAELHALDADHYDDRRQAERELERLRELIADTKEEIASMKEDAKGKKRSYAIVPYDGPHGTDRRPIYIECRRDEVILQPEGIKLGKKDFLPPLDAGNPLAAALRAAREEMLRQSPASAGGKRPEPYPLILVRPDGVETYYVVRKAIASWDESFGYEFVDGDWKLEFQPADPLLASAEHQAVEHARIRREILAAAAPRAYRSSGGGGGGGIGFDEEDDDDFFGGGSGSGARGEAGSGGRGGGSQDAGSPNGEFAAAGDATADANANRGGGAGGAGLAATGGSTTADSFTGSPSQEPGAGQPPGTSGGLYADARGDGTDAPAKGDATNGQPGGTTQRAAANGMGQPGGQPGGDPTGANGSGGASGSAPSAVASADGASSGSSASNGSAGAQSPMTDSAGPPAGMSLEANSQHVYQDLSQSRGSNWALEGNKGLSAVPVRRSIRVVVRGDRFAILPEQAAAEETLEGGREIPLPGPTSKHIDDIVAAVQQHVRDWGVAGRGLYWRPVLVVHVGPDGAARADELTRLLRNSGIELRASSVAAQRERNTLPRQ